MKIETVTLVIVSILLLLFLILFAFVYTEVSKIRSYKSNIYRVMEFSSKFKKSDEPVYDPDYFPGADIPSRFDKNLGIFLANTLLSLSQKTRNLPTGLYPSWQADFYTNKEDPSNPYALSIQSPSEPNVFILSIRGTDDIPDLLQDLEFSLTDFYIGGSTYGKVDAGFYTLYQSYLPRFESYLQQIPRNGTLYITGHSLGSAIAALLAMKAKQSVDNVVFYTFASPKIGNNVFVDFLNKIVPSHWTVLNQADVVPSLPLSLYNNFYQDFEKRVYINVQAGDALSCHFLTSYIAGLDPKNPNARKEVLWNIQPYQQVPSN